MKSTWKIFWTPTSKALDELQLICVEYAELLEKKDTMSDNDFNKICSKLIHQMQILNNKLGPRMMD